MARTVNDGTVIDRAEALAREHLAEIKVDGPDPLNTLPYLRKALSVGKALKDAGQPPHVVAAGTVMKLLRKPFNWRPQVIAEKCCDAAMIPVLEEIKLLLVDTKVGSGRGKLLGRNTVGVGTIAIATCHASWQIGYGYALGLGKLGPDRFFRQSAWYGALAPAARRVGVPGADTFLQTAEQFTIDGLQALRPEAQPAKRDRLHL